MTLFVFLFTSFVVNAVCDVTDGGKAPRIPLNDGNSIPGFGLGTFLGFDEKGKKEVKPLVIENAVTWALNAGYRCLRPADMKDRLGDRSAGETGYFGDNQETKLRDIRVLPIQIFRLLDTAAVYNTEEQIGIAVHQSPVPREHIYVVTKLAQNRQRDPVASLKKSLAHLNMSYVDLYLIHNPVAFKSDYSAFDEVDYLDTWKGMEEAKKLGLAKSIGLSNFNASQIERILSTSEIKPSVLQVEVNLNLAQNKLIEFCKEHDVVIMAYTPFGSIFEPREPAAPPPRGDDPILLEIGNKYNKTPAQVALRYLIQRGVIPIPKSVNKNRIEQNIDVFDFELKPEEMSTLGKFNEDYRTVVLDFWQDHPYYPYERRGNTTQDPFGWEH